MAPDPKKRSRPLPASSQRSKKRSKISQDALPWNEVQMPDMFEDAEGFFGLEEVEDVEVVREGNLVQFISAAAPVHSFEDEFEGFDDHDDNVSAEKLPMKRKDATKTKNKDQKKKAKSKQQSIEFTKKDCLVATDSGQNIFAALQEDAIQEECDVSAWDGLKLSSEGLSAIAKLGFTKPTPIQTASIPEILAGYDVVGKASTGSGKTLAFGIPILENWLEGRRCAEPHKNLKNKNPTALILSPTRELAHQLTQHIKALCSALSDSPHIATVTGGMSIQKQQRQLLHADIIVGTPGRLWDILSSDIAFSESLKQIKFLVVDEADRLLTEGHFKEAEEILNALDRQTDEDNDNSVSPVRQTLVFSATFDKSLQQKLASNGKPGLKNNAKSMEYLLRKLTFRSDKVRFVDVNPISHVAEGLEESIVECLDLEKDLYLYSLLLRRPSQRVLIFTNSIHSVRRLTPLLQNLTLPAYALHSQMSQKARLRAIERFSSDSLVSSDFSHSSQASLLSPASILVATDVAARGLDIPAVHVIHYHLPRTADSYVHRSGRSARASASGSSILLCAPGEVAATRRLVAKVQTAVRSLPIDRRIVAGLKRRVALAKGITDNALALDKRLHEGNWARTAAAELGVEYDSDEFGRVGGRRGQREQEARALTNEDLRTMRAELKTLLAQKINVI